MAELRDRDADLQYLTNSAAGLSVVDSELKIQASVAAYPGTVGRKAGSNAHSSRECCQCPRSQSPGDSNASGLRSVMN